jgi:hypothetical protein
MKLTGYERYIRRITKLKVKAFDNNINNTEKFKKSYFGRRVKETNHK